MDMHIHEFKEEYTRYYPPEVLANGYLHLSPPSQKHLLANAPFNYMMAVHDDGVTIKVEKCDTCGKQTEEWKLGKC